MQKKSRAMPALLFFLDKANASQNFQLIQMKPLLKTKQSS
ncbi:hypothetical protein B4096_2438 [Heyndrickxia coagulans]|jgi:hypothetical protein|uniref:Uncharacterized protein n=1 Tax=Heyndrickxia coagulans TaxID=1398 RepID=A0A150JVB2_HEYCO|nr:hypothetical protein B4098_2356 [Heyndrickxia coagulans]KYC61156.1 hypothetical protein B4099_2448 [Heyndrickxia coagulans]KYC71955.1 hypothetical protein B4096_2438 [Heyndrickxia coagulans]